MLPAFTNGIYLVFLRVSSNPALFAIGPLPPDSTTVTYEHIRIDPDTALRGRLDDLGNYPPNTIAFFDGEGWSPCEGLLRHEALQAASFSDWMWVQHDRLTDYLDTADANSEPWELIEVQAEGRVHYLGPQEGDTVSAVLPASQLPPPLLIAEDGTITPFEPADGEFFTLYELQRAVKGFIEYVYRIPDEPRRSMVVNEEGLLTRMDPNPTASLIAGRPLVGPVVFGPTRMLEGRPDPD